MMLNSEHEVTPAQDHAISHRVKRLNIFLIKPSKYDDDGYVIRHWKGVLPSNTLACLYSLSHDLKERQVFGPHLKWRIEAIDETVQRVNIKKIVRSHRQKGVKTVVCLVGVQSNQFPRASDLALRFREAGLEVMIGGFHVSGVIATFSELTPEVSRLRDAGVSIVAGEVEGRWESILRDVLERRSKPVYNFLNQPPHLSRTPLPQTPPNLVNRYAVKHFSTLDCGRGCPFQCTFCTVINVQGRQMRFRAVDEIVNRIRENFRRYKINHYFFTDDNFSRNQNWELIFNGLTRLREEEHIPLTFMMQVDTQSYRIPNFVSKAACAGCSQVFIGMESINEENLKAVGKRQNHTSCFKELIDEYHQAGIVTHLAYIVGFPGDTEASVQQDVLRLQTELGAEQASFFMMTPLPGSVDYRHLVDRGTILDADLNNYDSTHETVRHAHMKPGEWFQAYQNAWKSFYSVQNMKAILKKVRPKSYWGVFLNFVWYKNAIQAEGGHPMLHGFLRMKGRRDRRATFSLEPRWAYFKRRVQDVWHMLKEWVRLALEMEEVWLATRSRTPLETRVLDELGKVRRRVIEWRSFGLAELQEAYRRAAFALKMSGPSKVALPIRVPSRFGLWLRKWDVFSDSLTMTRLPMTRFWRKALRHFKSGRFFEIRIPEVVFMTFRESILLIRFFLCVLRQTRIFAFKK